MCSQYWSLILPSLEAPCGHVQRPAELQTHFMGDNGGLGRYRLNQRVRELEGFTGPIGEAFIGSCHQCQPESFFWCQGRARNGAIVEVGPPVVDEPAAPQPEPGNRPAA